MNLIYLHSAVKGDTRDTPWRLACGCWHFYWYWRSECWFNYRSAIELNLGTSVAALSTALIRGLQQTWKCRPPRCWICFWASRPSHSLVSRQRPRVSTSHRKGLCCSLGRNLDLPHAGIVCRRWWPQWLSSRTFSVDKMSSATISHPHILSAITYRSSSMCAAQIMDFRPLQSLRHLQSTKMYSICCTRTSIASYARWNVGTLATDYKS